MARVRAGEWSPPQDGDTTLEPLSAWHGFDPLQVRNGHEPAHKWNHWQRAALSCYAVTDVIKE